MMQEMLANLDFLMEEGDEDQDTYILGPTYNNSESSAMEIQSEMQHDKVSDNVAGSKVSSSLAESRSRDSQAEIIISSDTDDYDDGDDDDRDSHNNTSNVIPSIGRSATANDYPKPSSQLSDADVFYLFESDPMDLSDCPNRAPTMASSNGYRQAAASKTQDKPEAKVAEKTNDVIYTKTVSTGASRLESPRPGCSKDFDDTSSKNYFSNLDELLKDSRLIHALLPRLNYRLIYRTLCRNQFARNRVELTLWDLLPVERPMPNLRKRKISCKPQLMRCDESASLQEDQADTRAVVKEKKQRMRDDDGKLKGATLSSSAGKTEAADSSDANVVEQLNAAPAKKTKLSAPNDASLQGDETDTKTVATEEERQVREGDIGLEGGASASGASEMNGIEVDVPTASNMCLDANNVADQPSAVQGSSAPGGCSERNNGVPLQADQTDTKQFVRNEKQHTREGDIGKQVVDFNTDDDVDRALAVPVKPTTSNIVDFDTDDDFDRALAVPVKPTTSRAPEESHDRGSGASPQADQMGTKQVVKKKKQHMEDYLDIDVNIDDEDDFAMAVSMESTKFSAPEGCVNGVSSQADQTGTKIVKKKKQRTRKSDMGFDTDDNVVDQASVSVSVSVKQSNFGPPESYGKRSSGASSQPDQTGTKRVVVKKEKRGAREDYTSYSNYRKLQVVKHWKEEPLVYFKPWTDSYSEPTKNYHPDNAALPSTSRVLQPAKFLGSHAQPPLNANFKPPVPILSPPKLQLVPGPLTFDCHYEKMKRVRQYVDALRSPFGEYGSNVSVSAEALSRLPGPSNDKSASRDVPLSPRTAVRAVSRGALERPTSADMINANPYAPHFGEFCAQDMFSSDIFRAATGEAAGVNVADRQRAGGSMACYNVQEAGIASTSQIGNRGSEEHFVPPVGSRPQMLSTIKYNDIAQIGTEEVKVKLEVKSTADEQNAGNSSGATSKGKEGKGVFPNEKNTHRKIVLNERANNIYLKLLPMFSTVKTRFIKELCHDYVKEYNNFKEESLLEGLIETLLSCGQYNLKPIKPAPVVEEVDPSYDMNEQYADLLTIFPEADPVYLRKVVEDMHGDNEEIKKFVQTTLEKPDYPTRAQYLARKKITEQQKQYTTDFKVEQFLEIFPDPFAYFENDKRICQFNAHAIDFLKYYFSKMRVNTLLNAYTNGMHNLSLTAKALEALNPDMKSRRLSKYNKMGLTEDIPFLQECAFIQHKTELRLYLNEMKEKEEQEFNELKLKNELLECHCCFDNECMPSKCSTCEDGHVFCNSCIVRGTDVVLGDGNTRVDCLLNCGCEFPISVLQRVLPPTKFSILLCKRQEAEVMAAGVEGLVSCPFCHFASIPPPEDKVFRCLNPECMKESCPLCKELNHIPLKCNEKKTESARLFLEERMTEALVRKCFRCSRTFFKEEGCNKMTCLCGAQMCYICDKPVTDYRHFQGQGAENSSLCPLWSDDRRLNAESVIKVCQQTVKQIKEKDPKIDINVNALLPKLPPKSKGPHEDIHNAMVRDRIEGRQFPYR
ncbi:PREDICTED: uncharacterized protein LOC105564441 [Vollenhovia emeryi]|uniref:uncharacterized protein LOC105564441 n=1 Tax=Vollenhovia emeryi TaxID=411798 RepID=UPI0005F49F84|nr:PREDICTED: uncharacterized protein LOC105564441 [Vollenhovia emeryi]